MVYMRDQQTCRLRMTRWMGSPACYGPLTVHHIRKEGQGGPYVPLNLVSLCAWHNDWLETADGARWGEERGLVARRVPRGELSATLNRCWQLMRANGIVNWNAVGE